MTLDWITLWRLVNFQWAMSSDPAAPPEVSRRRFPRFPCFSTFLILCPAAGTHGTNVLIQAFSHRPPVKIRSGQTHFNSRVSFIIPERVQIPSCTNFLCSFFVTLWRSKYYNTTNFKHLSRWIIKKLFAQNDNLPNIEHKQRQIR